MLNIKSVKAIEIIVGVKYSFWSSGLFAIPKITNEFRINPQTQRTIDITPPRIVASSEYTRSGIVEFIGKKSLWLSTFIQQWSKDSEEFIVVL